MVGFPFGILYFSFYYLKTELKKTKNQTDQFQLTERPGLLGWICLGGLVLLGVVTS
jgi:hypothetical protein